MASCCARTQRILFSPHRLHVTTRVFRPASGTASRLKQLQSHTSTRNMASTYTANGENGDPGSTEGELNAWKHRPPYKVHDNDPNFHARYEASCHCGKVQYQLSREKPLDAKFCHCTTCQKLHGLCSCFPTLGNRASAETFVFCSRSSLPVGSHFSQGRYQLHTRSSRPRLVWELGEDVRAQAAVQG